MSELRLDPVEKYTVVIAPERNKRPKDIWENSNIISAECPFCPGNEEMTPPDSFSLKNNLEKWTIRTFPNKYPAFIDSSKAVSGTQEIIVESVNHNLNMGEYSQRHLTDILCTYKNRIISLKKKADIKYIVVFKNHGASAGASLFHPHSQIVGLGFVPAKIIEKTKALKSIFHKNSECYYCGLAKSSNTVYENNSFVSFIPETARFSYECWIIPKRHQTFYEETTPVQLEHLADVILKLLKSINGLLDFPALNLIINTGYGKKTKPFFHWNIQLVPRTTQLAGFEMATGFYINEVSALQAANQLKNLI